MNTISICGPGAARRGAGVEGPRARPSRGGPRGRGGRVAWCVAALLGLGGALLAGEPATAGETRPAIAAGSGSSDGGASGVAPEALAAGKLALAAAAAEKKAAYALDGADEEAALLEAARAYGVVADEPTYGLDERAEAAFRAGELLRARGRGDDAVQRFAHAVDLGRRAQAGRAREFGARGLLEQAHILRREGRQADAVTLYLRVGTEFPGQGKTAAQGTTWAIKLLVTLERFDEASALAEGFPTAWPDQPLECVKGVTTWVEELLDEGRPEDAAAVVDRLERDLSPSLTGDDEKMARRVADAVSALRVTVSPSGH
ncbi:MAG: tetratricopeptide repeat protein [Planctomycetes bacterium]|nr:tetratricopeptide repeat protein [Planctomycetota bacterium]